MCPACFVTGDPYDQGFTVSSLTTQLPSPCCPLHKKTLKNLDVEAMETHEFFPASPRLTVNTI